MPDRSTNPGRAPDDPSPNGSIQSPDTSAATLLLDQPAKSGMNAGGGQADAAITAERLDTLVAPVSLLAGQVEQLADEQPGSRTHGPETTPAEEHSKQIQQDQRDQPVSDAVPPQPDQRHTLEARMRNVADGLPALLERPGVRSTLLGVVLVGVAVALGVSSNVSVALLVVGVVMLIVGLMGRRLQGRFAIEFGPNGASFEIQTHMASPGSTQLVAPLAPWKPGRAVIGSASENTSPVRDTTIAAMPTDETT